MSDFYDHIDDFDVPEEVLKEHMVSFAKMMCTNQIGEPLIYRAHEFSLVQLKGIRGLEKRGLISCEPGYPCDGNENDVVEIYAQNGLGKWWRNEVDENDLEYLTREEHEVLDALLKAHPRLLNIVELVQDTNLSNKVCGDLINNLLSRGLVVRPSGERKGAGISPAGARLMGQLSPQKENL